MLLHCYNIVKGSHIELSRNNYGMNKNVYDFMLHATRLHSYTFSITHSVDSHTVSSASISVFTINLTITMFYYCVKMIVLHLKFSTKDRILHCILQVIYYIYIKYTHAAFRLFNRDQNGIQSMH